MAAAYSVRVSKGLMRWAKWWSHECLKSLGPVLNIYIYFSSLPQEIFFIGFREIGRKRERERVREREMSM